MASQSGERVFTSWKEIASFFGKGVRTVQRWERNFGLPISRPTAARNVVLATETELRDWIRRSSSQLAAENHNGNGDVSIAELSTRLHRLEQDTARLGRLMETFTERVERLSIHLASEDGSGQSKSKGGTALVPTRNLHTGTKHFRREKSAARNRKQ